VHVSVDHEIVFSLQLLMRHGGRLLYTPSIPKNLTFRT